MSRRPAPERGSALGSIRAVARDVLVYGSGELLLRAAAFLTLPIYTRYFGAEDYGILSFILVGQALLLTFVGLGSDSAYGRFFFEARTGADKRRVTVTWLAFLTVWSFGLVLVLVPLSPLLSKWSFGTRDHRDLVALGLLTVPVTLISAMLGQVLRNQFRAGLYAVVNGAATLLAALLGLLASVVIGWGLGGVLGGTLVGLVVFVPVRAFVARDMLHGSFSLVLLKRMLRFGGPLVPAALAWWIFELSDRFVLSKLSNLKEVGYYSVAAGLASILALVNAAWGQAWSPHAVRMYEEQRADAPAFFGRVMTYVLVAFGLLAVGVSAFAREIVLAVAGRNFLPAAAAVAPLALAFVAYASVQVTAASISLMKRTSYIALFAWVTAIVNVVLNLVFVPIWGMRGSAWATFAAYLLLTLCYFVVSQRIWPVSYETPKVVTTAALTVLFTVLAPQLPRDPALAGTALRIAWCGVFVALLLWTRVLDARERGELARLMRRGWRTPT